jgi:hypothetical protein
VAQAGQEKEARGKRGRAKGGAGGAREGDKRDTARQKRQEKCYAMLYNAKEMLYECYIEDIWKLQRKRKDRRRRNQQSRKQGAAEYAARVH